MILVFGKNGQVAKALQEVQPNFIYLSSQETPFTEPLKVLKALDHFRPQVVINASAYTAVDKAESERDLALQVNAHILKDISHWCLKNNAKLIHYSTDYVFDGSGTTPWIESDQPAPINWYGHTKYKGEQAIIASRCDHYILRLSWVHSPWGNNFKKTILKLAQEREELRIVSDQWGAPTDARDIAQATVKLINKLHPTTPQTPQQGIYHLRFNEYTTWYDFALKIIADAKKEGLPIKTKTVHAILSEDYSTPAQRPKNSRLGTIHTPPHSINNT